MYSHVYIFGNGSTALECAALLCRHSIKPCFVEYSANDFSFARNKLTSLEIDYIPFHTAVLEEIASRKRSLVVSVSNRYIFPHSFVSRANVDIINYHNSLLPRYRGMHAEAWAIYEGEKETGITWHKIDGGIDTGPILAQRRVPIDNNTTSLSLLRQQSIAAVGAFDDMLSQLLAGTQPSVVQARNEKSEMHLGKERPNDGELDPHWPEDKIWRFLRAFDYGCTYNLGLPRIFWQGKQVTWRRYKKFSESNGASISTVIENGIVLHGKFLLHGIRQL